MKEQPFGFTLQCTSGRARRGELRTPHATVPTPVFMPVGTAGAVKTLSRDDVAALGARLILGNTYHLYLRPGHELVAAAGGLHRFTGWQGAMLTDSGGFQVMSLADFRKITPDGVQFQSHLDGSRHFFTPERAIEVQNALGADIIMAFDECPPYPAEESYVKKSLDLTLAWAKRCHTAHQNPQQALFGIVQGGVFPHLRKQSVQALMDMGFPGYAIGGLAVGEPKEQMWAMTSLCCDELPVEKPRYLMGVGTPVDLLNGVAQGVDMFDCVMPTRNARKGSVFTWQGRLVIKAGRYKSDFGPIDEKCDCYVCRNFSRAYIRHLLNVGEVLGMRLASYHSLYFYQQLMQKIRESIENNTFEEFRRQTLAGFEEGESRD